MDWSEDWETGLANVWAVLEADFESTHQEKDT
jgi:hypothetical protein